MRSLRCLVPGLIAPALLSGLALQATASSQANPTASVRQSEHVLGLARSLPVSVGVQPANGRIYTIVGSAILLELSWHSVRSPKYRLLVQRADGKVVEKEPGPVRTLRGHVVGMPGTAVAAALVDRGITARIRTAKGEDYWLQPAPAIGLMSAPGLHVFYRGEDVIKTERGCGAEALPPRPGGVPARPAGVKGGVKTGEGSPGGGGLAPMASTSVAELACDADYEYYTRWGSVTGVVNRIEAVVNTMNLQYDRDVGITHQLTTILVRTGSSQPYTSTDPVTLLYQFRDHWNANQAGISRDVAQLFTGKSLDGSTIGIAWIGTVCNLSYAYSLVQSDFNNNFGCATDLSAHELGHSWNADHCGGCNNYTMNRFITCANQFHPKRTVPEIVRFRDSRSCLGSGGGGGGTATSVRVAVSASTQGIGKGEKKGMATVVVTDDLGVPVAGATVTGDFSGTFTESDLKDTTDANGSVTFLTSGSAKGKVSVTFCVTAVSAPLPWSQTPAVCDSN